MKQRATVSLPSLLFILIVVMGEILGIDRTLLSCLTAPFLMILAVVLFGREAFRKARTNTNSYEYPRGEAFEPAIEEGEQGWADWRLYPKDASDAAERDIHEA